MTNKERAQRAEVALAAYPGGDPVDLSSSIVALVTDLMHLAAQNGISPDDVAETSQDHFDIEDVAERGFYLGEVPGCEEEATCTAVCPPMWAHGHCGVAHHCVLMQGHDGRHKWECQ